jgi:hypothetical protein
LIINKKLTTNHVEYIKLHIKRLYYSKVGFVDFLTCLKKRQAFIELEIMDAHKFPLESYSSKKPDLNIKNLRSVKNMLKTIIY